MTTPFAATRAAALEVLHYTARGPCGHLPRTAGWGYAEPYTRDWMIAALGILAAWATIVLCQLRFYRMAHAGTLQRPRFRMPLAPYSGYVTLAFLAAVLVLMMLDAERGPWVIATLAIGIPILVGGWYLVRHRVMAATEQVAGDSEDVPVAANPDD